MATFKFGNNVVKVNGRIDRRRVEKATCLFLNKVIIEKGVRGNENKHTSGTINKK